MSLKKSGFIVFNLLLLFYFYVHQVIFCLFVSLSVGLFVCTQNIYRNINGQSFTKFCVKNTHMPGTNKSIN